MDEKTLDTKALSLPERARKILIRNDEEYKNAGEFLKATTALRKDINEFCDPIIKKQRDALEEARNKKNSKLDPVVQAESIVKNSMSKYTMEQERLRRIEAEKRQLEAQKKHEAEVLARAAEQEKAGNKEDAEMILEEVEELPVIIPTQEKPKAKGIRTTQRWKWQLINAKAVKPDYLCIDNSKIGKQVRATGKQAEKLVGGIRVYQETSTSITGR